ncbi:formyltransferase family protein [Pararobbsia alpina]|uniref:Methionyl-tRNA formyltransferase n=1 Tax=Pararobbsia alpina TaxID=621374 RepID=A0A6S7AWQ9_9BURK|nr:formyltransferase family protein [Pararobbsia alpina]CAB3775967.1 Methionyl-tRNA formyltransferase [Pararobbsia alpina]
MRFAIATIDRYQIVLEAFLQAGWSPVKVFSTTLLSPYDSNAELLARAEALSVPVQLSPIRAADFVELGELGCEALVVAGHPWRIGEWRNDLSYAINFHPSPLPEARGPYPQMRAILEQRREWAVSCHKLDAAFDTGDVLAQHHFPMHAAESHETLDLKIQLATAQLAARVAADLPSLWSDAAPQQGGTYWPYMTEAERTLDLTLPVEPLLRTVRAFGLTECMARVGGGMVFVRRAEGWIQPHRIAPGTLVHRSGERLLIAVADGFVALLEWSPLSPEMRRSQARK